MRRQRNLHLIPSCSHVKVSNFSSFAVSSNSSSCNRPANGHTNSKLRPAQSSLSSRTENGSKSTLLNFQTRSASTQEMRDTNNFDDSRTKREEVSSYYPQRSRSRNRPKDLPFQSFLVRRTIAEKSVSERAIQLTPWRGNPSLLHALGFIRELEDKYGKIWWAGLSKEKANPYEYNPVVVVIFEDAASISRIPGFTTPGPPELPKPLNPPNSMSSKSSSNPNSIDLGPSSSLDPLANPHSQALLKHVGSRLRQNKSTAPLFVPWSESLNTAAYRQGGPALEDVLPFLAPKKAGDLPIDALPKVGDDESGETPKNALVTREPAGRPTTFQKASWDEWDEMVNIDAVLRRYTTESLYLPSPFSTGLIKAALSKRYFRPQVRLLVARAMVDFAGFSEKPTLSMAELVTQWQKDLDARHANVWVPWNESLSDSFDVAEEKENGEDVFDPLDTEDELQFDDLTTGAWPVANPGLSDISQEGEVLVSKVHSYQRIADDDYDDGEDDAVGEWEGIGAHPLQYPRGLDSDAQGAANAETSQFDLTATVRSRLSTLPTVLDQLSQTSPPTEPPNNPPILTQVDKRGQTNDNSPSSSRRSRHSEELRDPWRTDPRPFRSGLGGDDPSSLYPGISERNDSGSALPRRERWSKPGLASMSPEAKERGAMINGSHSTKSEGWDKDRRGRKLRSREEVEMLKEFGLGNIDELAAGQMEKLRAARSKGDLGKRETWQVREERREGGSNFEENAARISALAGKEQRLKEVKNLKDRLRAILDGTKVD